MKFLLLSLSFLFLSSFSGAPENPASCKLRLLSITCIKAEDFFGDEAYIVVGGSRLRTMYMSSEDEESLNSVNLIEFYDSIVIRLYDEDDGPNDPFDSDDFLGEWTVYCEESRKGTKTAIFGSERAAAFYKLSYEVY